MRKKLLLIVAALVALYIGSYGAVSANREIRFVGDRYRIVSMNNSLVSDDVALMAYKPLLMLDELTLGSSDLDVKPE